MSGSQLVSDVRPSPFEPLGEPDERQPIYSGFLATVSRHPKRRAVSDEHHSLSFLALERSSRELAAAIVGAANGGSRVVAIHGHRNVGLVVALLAATRAGFTFAVLDASYPRERLRLMASIIAPALIIGDAEADPEWRAAFEGLTPAYLSMNSVGELVEPSATNVQTPQTIDHGAAEIAYLLFTSGTTGTPKCIATKHAPLRHFVAWYQERFCPKPGDRFSLLSGLGHDPVLRDIFVPLSSGAEIVIPPQALVGNPKSLFEWVSASAINYMHGTPPLFKLLHAGSQGRLVEALRFIYSGGDQLRRSLVTQLHDVAPNAQLVNFYGTTETPQAMAFYEVPRGEDGDIVPVGRGIRDAQLLVLTETNTLAAIGESGQVGIRTRFLSAGYWGDPNATSQRFIQSPYSQDPSDLVYLTGDYGFYRDDGAVVIKGRADDQVKIRGYRVELAEINQVIESVPGIRAAMTLAHQLPAGESALVAYIAADVQQKETLQHELNERLKSKLPPYMVPARTFWMDQLPLLPNRKVDRQALVGLWEGQLREIRRQAAAADSPEARLAQEWSRILGILEIPAHQSFIELGGDSLSFIQASIAVEKQLGWLPDDWAKVPLSELAGRDVRSSTGWRSVDTTILIRALSIVLIVLGHLTPYETTGAVAVLFMLAGWSFASFQGRAVINERSSLPVLRTAFKIVLPTLLATAWQNWGHFQERWWAFLMLSSYHPVRPYRVAGFSFIDVLIQIYIVIAIVFCFRVTREWLANHPYRFSVAATGLAMAAGVAIHLVWDTKYIYNYVPHMYLWYVFCGMAMCYASSVRKRLLMAGLLLFAAALSRLPLFSLAAALGLLFIRRISLPAIVTGAVTSIAASSLYIYITHDKMGALLYRTIWGANVELEPLGAIEFHSLVGIDGWVLTVVLIAVGVAIGKIWNLGYAAVTRQISPSSKQEALGTVGI